MGAGGASVTAAEGGAGMTIRLRNWQTGTPDVGRVVWVWYYTTAILAAWDGAQWHTADGDGLRDVTHWHAR